VGLNISPCLSTNSAMDKAEEVFSDITNKTPACYNWITRGMAQVSAVFCLFYNSFTLKCSCNEKYEVILFIYP